MNINAWHIRKRASTWLASLGEGSVLLDLGAGGDPVGLDFRRAGRKVILADRERRSRHVDILCDGRQLPFRPGAFDAILLTEVLEHVDTPGVLLRQCFGATRPGGQLFLSWPCAFPLHEIPHDYWRPTEFGVAVALEQAGFTVSRFWRRGGALAVTHELIGQPLLGILVALTRLPMLGAVFVPLRRTGAWFLAASYKLHALVGLRMPWNNPRFVGDQLNGWKGALANWVQGYCLIADRGPGPE